MMNMRLKELSYAVYEKLNRTIGSKLCDMKFFEVRKTLPIDSNEMSDVVVFSMMGKDVLDAYLIAIKSFLYWYGDARVHVLSDGTLGKEEVEILNFHIPNIEISEISDVNVGSLPRGGCWERLVKLIELSEANYVIQLDSDIVVNGPVPEIHEAVNNKHSFVIGDPVWNKPVSISYLSRVANRLPSSHVQTLSEQVLPLLPMFKNKKFYFLRGCAGFSGFPKGEVTYSGLEMFSTQMEGLLGKEKWSSWGSEQVSSNYLASTCTGAHVLPWPKYQTFMYPLSMGPVCNASVVHFMGSKRFVDGTYCRLGGMAIKTLLNSFKK